MPPQCLQHFIGRVSSLHVALHSGQGEHLHHAALTSVLQKAEQLLAGYSVGWTVKQGSGKKAKSSFEKGCTNLGTFLPQKEKSKWTHSACYRLTGEVFELIFSNQLLQKILKMGWSCDKPLDFCEHYQFSTTKDPFKLLLVWPMGFNSINCG